MKTIPKVTPDNLKTAHQEGCSDVKKVLENLYGKEFFEPEKNRLEEILDNFGNKVYTYPVEIKGHYIKVPVPHANSAWTFQSFDWVKRFCKKYPICYPEYDNNFNPKFIYINCSNL